MGGHNGLLCGLPCGTLTGSLTRLAARAAEVSTERLRWVGLVAVLVAVGLSLGAYTSVDQQAEYSGSMFGEVFEPCTTGLNKLDCVAGGKGPSEVKRAGQPQISKHVADDMAKRGWTENMLYETLNSPHRVVATRDTRHRLDGSRLDEPATAYIRQDGHYLVVNNRANEIIAISDRTKPDWKSPFD